MTPTEAAIIIGCSPQQVRTLCRTGKLKAKKVKTPGGYYYNIPPAEARRYAIRPQTMGWPRGQSYEWE